jgi:PKD repeat protein
LTVEDERGLPAYDSQLIDVQVPEMPQLQSPEARIVITMDAGELPATVGFTSDSEDPDGIIVAHRWTFHDGTTDTGSFVTKDYHVAGSYDVRLEVEDDAGLLGSDDHTAYVTLGNEIPPRIVSLPHGQARVGEAYAYDLDGRPAAQGSRPVTWRLGKEFDGQVVNLPAGMLIDERSGELTWTPTAEQQGPQPVTLTASNDAGRDRQEFIIDVTIADGPKDSPNPPGRGCSCGAAGGCKGWFALFAVALLMRKRRYDC